MSSIPSTPSPTTQPTDAPAPSIFRGIPDSDDPLKRDFRLFLYVIWAYYGWTPSPLQLSMAYYLQWGPSRLIIMAFRGASKSWIAGAYCLWLLYCNAEFKILVLSGSQKRAVAFTQWCLNLLSEIDILRHLRPGIGQRCSALAFDVAGCKPDQTPSLNALGYNSQTAGWRADFIVPDDVETAQNSLTVLMREKILELVPEYEAILKPGGKIAFLGTPHSEDSSYVKLYKERGYQCRIWPAIFPDREMQRVYGERLAGFIKDQIAKRPHLVGTSTEPVRFSMEELEKRRLGSTQAEFQLQYLLDTTLADAEKYPLKVRNLVCLALDPKRGPDYTVWGEGVDLVLKDLPSLGFDGDYFHKPMAVAEEFSEWEETVAWIDPAGGRTEGSDEAAIAITSLLNGTVYLRYSNGWHKGFEPDTLRMMANALVHYGVGRCTIESNFGDGMFLALLKPYVEASWKDKNKGISKMLALAHGVPTGTKLEEIRSVRVAKEQRILSVLEVVVNQHRLVVDKQVVERDYASALNYQGDTKLQYSLFYQFTHLGREKDSLSKDDRLEALGGAVGLFAAVLGVDPLGQAAVRASDRSDASLERILADADALQTGDFNEPRPTARPKAVNPRKR